MTPWRCSECGKVGMEAPIGPATRAAEAHFKADHNDNGAADVRSVAPPEWAQKSKGASE